MEALKFISTATLALIVLSGCAKSQPVFDSKHTEVKIVNGKSYKIPYGASPSPYVDTKVIKFYQTLGLSDCKEGDITWEEEKAKDEMNAAIRNGDKNIYRKLAKEGRIGCASPFTVK